MSTVARTPATQGLETPGLEPLPGWIALQTQALLRQRGHAWLLQGPSGLGQYSVALALARAWLCEHVLDSGACGHCPSCHAIDVRTHADLCVLMPETEMLERHWPLSEKAQADIDDKKRKPSREIRVEAMREAVEFSQRTSARGAGKVVLVYPAERMNTITANALLKTLEEPPGDVRFVLASEAAHDLLPTIRSRCQSQAMTWPTQDEALGWLQTCGLDTDEAKVWLKAAGDRPEDALAMARAGLQSALWSGFPKAMQNGDVALVKDWAAAALLGALQKLCHDALCVAHGAAPRFFRREDLPARASSRALSQWSRELMAMKRTVEHPFNAGLLLEALVNQAQSALNSGP